MSKVLVLFLLIVLFVYWIGFQPGFKAANDLPYSSEEFVQQLLNLPSAWNPYGGVFGQNQLSTLWAWPSNQLYAIAARLDLSFGIMVSIIGILPIIIIGFFGMYFYLKFFINSQTARGVGSLFFLINTYILLLIDGGQLLWGLAYGLIPWCLFFLEKNLERKTVPLISVVPVLVLSFADLRAVYLLSLLILIRFLYEFIYLPKANYWSWIRVFFWYGLTAGLFLICLHAYWWLPLIFSQSSLSPANLVVSSKADFLHFTSLGHALLLLQPHWYQNNFGNITSIRVEFLPILPLLLLTIFQRKKLIGYWLLVMLVGIFLTKGTNPPFGEVYSWLLEEIPGFFLFRDPSKFFLLIAIAYSILLARVFQFFETKRIGPFESRVIVPFLIVVYLILLVWPVYTNQMTGLLGFAKQNDEYLKIQQKLAKNPQAGRVLWIPDKKPSGYMDSNSVSVNGTDLVNIRPFTTGIRGTYETLNFLREASYSGELLAVSGIKNIVYSPKDPRKKYKVDESDYYWLFLQQLRERNWLEPSLLQENVLTLKNPVPLFSIPNNYYFVVGSDRIYEDSTKSASLSLRSNGLIFTEDKPVFVSNRLENNPILLYHKDKLDLIMQQLAPRWYFPAVNLTNSPDYSGWWKKEATDFLSFKDFLVQKYGINNQDFDLGGGWSIAEGKTVKDFKISGQKGDYILLRALESTRSGQITIESEKGFTQTVDLQKNGDNVKWQLVGQAHDDFSQLKILTSGDISLINALAIVPISEYKTTEEKINNLNNIEVNFLTLEKKSLQPLITYTKVNNDWYWVKVSGILKPSLIVFNQQFDPKWQLNGQSALPVYTIFNGFIVNQDGEYFLEYSPHRYLFWSGIISFGSLLILLGSVVYRYYGYKSQ